MLKAVRVIEECLSDLDKVCPGHFVNQFIISYHFSELVNRSTRFPVMRKSTKCPKSVYLFTIIIIISSSVTIYQTCSVYLVYLFLNNYKFKVFVVFLS